MPSVLITGASGTIGRGLSLSFAKAGYDVGVHYNRNRESAEEVANEVRALGVKASIVTGSVAKQSDIAAMFEILKRELGGVDVMVNNAGVTRFFSILEATEEQFDEVVDTDLKGSYFCTQAAVRDMISRNVGGVVINITSNHQKGCWPEANVYGPVKAALEKFTMNAAMDLAPYGVRVVAIAPGYTGPDDINDPGIRRGWKRHYDHIASHIPGGRFCTASEVGAAAVYLASDAAGYITGTCLTMDGGALLPVYVNPPTDDFRRNPGKK